MSAMILETPLENRLVPPHDLHVAFVFCHARTYYNRHRALFAACAETTRVACAVIRFKP